MLGAQAFLENPALKARVGAVINVEARGTRGRSLLFQTSPGDSTLIDIYARSVPFYSTRLAVRGDLSCAAERHRPDAVHPPGLPVVQFRLLRQLSPTTTRRSTAART